MDRNDMWYNNDMGSNGIHHNNDMGSNNIYDMEQILEHIFFLEIIEGRDFEIFC